MQFCRKSSLVEIWYSFWTAYKENANWHYCGIHQLSNLFFHTQSFSLIVWINPGIFFFFLDNKVDRQVGQQGKTMLFSLLPGLSSLLPGLLSLLPGHTEGHVSLMWPPGKALKSCYEIQIFQKKTKWAYICIKFSDLTCKKKVELIGGTKNPPYAGLFWRGWTTKWLNYYKIIHNTVA